MKKSILGWNLDAFDLSELQFFEKMASQDAGWSHWYKDTYICVALYETFAILKGPQNNSEAILTH